MHASGNLIAGAWRYLAALAVLICAATPVVAAGYTLTGRINGPDGMWVSGLSDGIAVITVGQEFVNDGERVQTVQDRDNRA